MWELFGPLLTGGRLAVVPFLISRAPEGVLNLLVREGVTILNQTPSAFYQLMRADRDGQGSRMTGLRCVVLGGEALDVSRLEEWSVERSATRPLLVNMYGITETTVHATYQPLDQEVTAPPGSSWIGRSLLDLRAYVLDDALAPAPVGVAGELYISGPGLARGYLRRPGLTAERFVADPYASAGTRLYRTGDLAKRAPDGRLVFLGRADDQVKIRGYRIELGEVETSLRAQPGVQDAVVVAREDPAGDQRLIGYIVATSETDGGTLRRRLAETLPDYLIPAAVMRLEELPRTPNGKVDQQALPAPESTTSETSYRAPQTSTEETLCGLFAEVLEVQQVGLDDNFFELGGHSLMATRLVSRIRSTLGVELAIRTLFESPTVGGIAGALVGPSAARDSLVPMIRPAMIPLSPAPTGVVVRQSVGSDPRRLQHPDSIAADRSAGPSRSGGCVARRHDAA